MNINDGFKELATMLIQLIGEGNVPDSDKVESIIQQCGFKVHDYSVVEAQKVGDGPIAVVFPENLVQLFKETSMYKEPAKLSAGRGEIKPEYDEEGYLYIPECTELLPTTLMKNGEWEHDMYDYPFLVLLINEFRKKVLENEQN
ncbi:hypothetical protein D3C75_789320 [compost metagenome]